MRIRHRSRGRITPRGPTPRRLAAARRALQRERDRLPLFADQVVAEQVSPDERIRRIDQEQLADEQSRRDLAARHWNWGREQLLVHSPAVRHATLDKWNVSSIPADAAYFADFVRRELRKRDTSPADVC